MLKRKYIVYTWVFLYPILPRFFVIGKYPVYTYFTFICAGLIGLMQLSSGRKAWKKDLVIVLLGYLLLLLTYIYQGEVMTFLRNFIEVFSIYFIICSYVSDRGSFNKIVEILLKSCLVLCIFGIIDVVTHFNIFSLVENAQNFGSMGTASMIRLGMKRVESSFGQPLSFSLYLTICSSLCFYMFKIRDGHNGLYKKIYILIWINIILTVSRFPIVLFAVLQLLFTMQYTQRKKIRILSGVIIGGILSMIFIVLADIPFLNDVSNMFLVIISPESNSLYKGVFGGNENPFSYRFELFKDVPKFMTIYQVNKLFGIGSLGPTLFGRSIDCEYLFILLCYGWLGLIGKYLIFIVPMLKSMIYTFKLGKHSRVYTVESTTFNIKMLLTMIVYLINLSSVAQLDEFRIANVALALLISNMRLMKAEDDMK